MNFTMERISGAICHVSATCAKYLISIIAGRPRCTSNWL